jgi:hypothetical protein
MAANVQITNDALIVEGASIPLTQVLAADVQHIDVLLRGAVIFVLCCFGPIVAMVLATMLDGPDQGGLRLIATIAAGPGAVALGIVLSFIWKKPWAVVFEIATVGYRAIKTENEEQANALAVEIKKAISA